MSLLESIRARRRLTQPGRPDTGRLSASAASIEKAFGQTKASALSVQQAIDQVREALDDWQWDAVNTGTVASVSRAYLRGEVHDGRVAAFVRRELSATSNPSLIDTICDAYLNDWDPREARTTWLSGLIPEKSAFLARRWNRLFLALPELLDAQNAPRLVAERMVVENDAFSWLEECGMSAPHSGPLMRQAHLEWLTLLPPVRNTAQLERVFAWIRPRDRKPMESGPVAKTVDKLLEPWHTSMPDPALRQEVLERLLSAYGDPRNAKPEFWGLVSDASRRVLNRWLAGQSMDALLRVIQQATATHMWPPRHDFWKGLHDRGLVQEAWVALSPAAAKISADLFNRTGDALYENAGLQTSKGRRDTCLLIMRIGRYVVVEGSHDYRVHVFAENDRRAPQLYQSEYDADELTLPADDPMARRHDPTGNWMRWVQERVSR